MWRRTTIPMQIRLMMRTVLGAILKPVLSSEKYFNPDPPFFVDISIIIINTCKSNQINNHTHHSRPSLPFLQQQKIAKSSSNFPLSFLAYIILKTQLTPPQLMKYHSHVFFPLLLSLLVAQTLQCHYSCLECLQTSFSSCISCPQNKTIEVSVTSQAGSQAGTCATFLNRVPNILGIIFLAVTITTCTVMGGEKIFYFIFMLQTLGLLFLVQVYWIPEINYLLQSLSYFMVFSYISFPIKQSAANFRHGTGYKSIYFIKNASLTQNIMIVGPVALALFILLIFLPIVKACRSPSPRRWLPDWKLQKFIQGTSTFFFLIIQEMTTIIFISLSSSNDNTVGDILITVSYFFFLFLYIFNQCRHPLPFFRNRYSQFFIFISRIIGPLFVTFSQNLQWIFYLYIFVLILFEAIATNENKDRRGINRLFYYKFGFILIFGITLAYYIVEKTANSQKTSTILGIITFIGLLFFVFLFFIELLFSIQSHFCFDRSSNEPSATEENISVEGDIQNQKKVFAGNFSQIPKTTKSKTKDRTKQSNTESLANIDSNIIDFSTISFEQNLVFTFPDEEHEDSIEKKQKAYDKLEVLFPQNECSDSFPVKAEASSLQKHPSKSKKSESSIADKPERFDPKQRQREDIE